MGKREVLPSQAQGWVDARRRHGLSHAHVQMASELGLNPAKLGKLDNHRQEPWKTPLPEFIEYLYARRFGRQRPDVVVSTQKRHSRPGATPPNGRPRRAAVRRQSGVEGLGE